MGISIFENDCEWSWRFSCNELLIDDHIYKEVWIPVVGEELINGPTGDRDIIML